MNTKLQDAFRSMASKASRAVAVTAGLVAVGVSMTQNASAELSVTPITTAITSNIVVVEGLVATGFLVTALWIGVKLIKKGSGKIG